MATCNSEKGKGQYDLSWCLRLTDFVADGPEEYMLPTKNLNRLQIFLNHPNDSVISLAVRLAFLKLVASMT